MPGTSKKEKADQVAQKAGEEIRALRGTIDLSYQKIRDIAKQHIPDFHFLNYQVSTFWRCEHSPIGMCVFILDENCRPTECRYCGGPVERK